MDGAFRTRATSPMQYGLGSAVPGELPGDDWLKRPPSKGRKIIGAHVSQCTRIKKLTLLHCICRLLAHRDRRRFDGPLSLSGHCGHEAIFGAQRSVANDPEPSAPGSWRRIGGESPPRGRSSQPPRPRVMHEVLLARAAVKRSQGRPRAEY